MAIGSMETVLQFVAMLFLSSVVLVTIVAALWIVKPVDRQAKRRELPIQYALSDIFCLFLLIQGSAAAIYGVASWLGPSWRDSDSLLVPNVLAWLVLSLIWWACVRVLSRAGIACRSHRAIFLVVVVPTTLIGPFIFWGLLLGLQFACETRTLSAGLALLTSLLAIVAGMYACGRFTRRMVAEALAQPPQIPREREE